MFRFAAHLHSYRKYILDFRKQILLLITVLSHIQLFWFFNLFFYHVTLCVSAVFAIAQSATLVHCIQTAEDIFFVKLLSQPGSPIILVFLTPMRWYPIPRGTHSAGEQNTQGWEICDFLLKSSFISVRDRPIVAVER